MAAAAGAGPEIAAPVHLLVGEESFLRERRLRELVERLTPQENAVYNVDVYAGADAPLDRVVASCEMLPMFAGRRLVVVRGADLRAAAGHPGFVAYLRRPNPSTLLLLSSEGFAAGRGGRGAGDDDEADGAGEGGKPGKAGKAGKGKERVTQKELLSLLPSREEFPALRSDAAADFVRAAARLRGVEVDPAATRELLELVGLDAARLDDEIEKAALYAGAGKRITVDDVEALARRTRAHSVFELIDAVVARDRGAVLVHLGALYEDGAEPLMLVGMLAWHLRRTLRGAALAESGAGSSEVARAVGVQFRTAERFAATCQRLGTAGATRAIVALREVDRRLKSTAEDEKLVLERTLLAMMAG